MGWQPVLQTTVLFEHQHRQKLGEKKEKFINVDITIKEILLKKKKNI
jgi:hypothetical protein